MEHTDNPIPEHAADATGSVSHATDAAPQVSAIASDVADLAAAHESPEHLVSPAHTDRVRIVQVVNSLAPAGAELLMADLARSLNSDRYDVHVLVVRDGQLRSRIEQAGLPVYRTGYEFDYTSPLALAKMVEHIRRIQPHIVHTHLLGSDILGRIAALFAGVPIIVSTQHDTYKRSVFYELYRRTTVRFVSAQVAISDTVAEFCRSRLKTPIEKLHVINNGVDAARFARAETPWREPVTFGAVGSLIPVKGHEYLIRAFAGVTRELPGTRLRLAGDGSERERLESLADALGVREAIDFEGVVTNMPSFLSSIDVLVHPSLMEGLGLAVLEAMAAAKPVIASDIPALAQVLDYGTAGRLVPPADPDALAEAMLEVARAPDAAVEMAHAGQTRAFHRYSLESTVSAYADLYEELIEDAHLEGADMEGTAPHRRRPGFNRLLNWLRYALLLVVGAFIFQALRRGFAESSFVSLDFNPRYLAASFALFAAYYLSFINALRLLFAALGHRLGFIEVFKLSFMSNVGKYVPGGIWPIASRMALSSRVGIEPPQMLVVSALESALSVVGGSVVVLAAFALGAPAPAQLPPVVIILTALASIGMLHPAVLRFTVRIVARLLHVEGQIVGLPTRSSVRLALYYAFTWTLAGAGFYTFVHSLLPHVGANLSAYAGYYAAGAIIGLIVLFAPGGLGAREGALVLLLAGPIGTAQAAMVALSVRVWTTLIELLMSALAVVLPFSSERAERASASKPSAR